MMGIDILGLCVARAVSLAVVCDGRPMWTNIQRDKGVFVPPHPGATRY